MEPVELDKIMIKVEGTSTIPSVPSVLLGVSSTSPTTAVPLHSSMDEFSTKLTSQSVSFDANKAKIFLQEANWPPGLQDALIKNLDRFHCRYMIIDDSSSMIEQDGHCLVPVGNSYR